MEKFVVCSQELVRRLNAALAVRGVSRFNVATLVRRDDENSNWEINGHEVFGRNIMDNDEMTTSREVERLFADDEVNWSIQSLTQIRILNLESDLAILVDVLPG